MTETAEAVETIRYTADVVCDPRRRRAADHAALAAVPGQPALPGGHVDPGEQSRAAAAREAREETGVRIDPADLTLIGVYDGPDRDPRGRYVSVAYRVDVPADTTAQAGDDAATVRWVPLDALPDDLAFDHGTILADMLRRQPAGR